MNSWFDCKLPKVFSKNCPILGLGVIHQLRYGFVRFCGRGKKVQMTIETEIKLRDRERHRMTNVTKNWQRETEKWQISKFCLSLSFFCHVCHSVSLSVSQFYFCLNCHLYFLALSFCDTINLPGPVNRIKFVLILWKSPPMQRCKKSSGLAKKSQASLENFRTASNAGMPYFIPFDSAVFFFNTIDRDRIKGLTPRGIYRDKKTDRDQIKVLWGFEPTQKV